MEGYQKYLFDNFIIEDKKISKDSEEETVYQDNSEEIIDAAVDVFAAEDVEPEKNELIEEPLIFPQQTVETIAENIETETKIIENTTVEPSYSKEDLDLAIKEAEERGYQKGLEAARQDVLTQQNVLLDEVRNQLMTIFADIDNKFVMLSNTIKEGNLNYLDGVRDIVDVIRVQIENNLKNIDEETARGLDLVKKSISEMFCGRLTL